MATEWETVRLCEVARTRNGAGIKQDAFCETGVPLARVSDFTDGSIDMAACIRVNFDHAKRWEGHRLHEGDAVVATVGSWPPNWSSVVGKAVRVPRSAAGAIQNQNTCCVLALPSISDQRFLFYLLRSEEFAHYAANSAAGSASQARLPVANLERFEFALPPLAEQKAIAAVLGVLDDKIELNRRMNETLEGLARAIFQSWFVDFDGVRRNAELKSEGGRVKSETSAISPFSFHPSQFNSLFPDSFEDSELGKIPKGWQARPLYETARYVNGAAFKDADFCDPTEGVPVVKIAELKSGISGQTRFSMRVLDPTQQIDTGALLYSWSGSPDTSLDVFVWSKGPGLLNQHIFNVLANSAAQSHFVYYLLKHLRPTLVETARNKQTTGLGHVTVADMKRIRVCYPPDRVLVAFDQLVGPVFERCFSNSLESERLAAIRDALLPRLLSGEIRVAEAERLVEETT